MNAIGPLVDIHSNATHQMHGNPRFLPWHGIYLPRLEELLMTVDPSVCIPYWTSSEEQAFMSWLLGFAPTVTLASGPHTVTRIIGAFATLPDAAAVAVALANATHNPFAGALEGVHNSGGHHGSVERNRGGHEGHRGARLHLRVGGTASGRPRANRGVSGRMRRTEAAGDIDPVGIRVAPLVTARARPSRVTGPARASTTTRSHVEALDCAESSGLRGLAWPAGASAPSTGTRSVILCPEASPVSRPRI